MSVTLSPAEFGVLVDLALNANAPVGRVLQFGDLFARCAKLANVRGTIGEIPALPALGPSGAELTYAERNRLNDPIMLSDN
jgi:hypothetical protein